MGTSRANEKPRRAAIEGPDDATARPGGGIWSVVRLGQRTDERPKLLGLPRRGPPVRAEDAIDRPAPLFFERTNERGGSDERRRRHRGKYGGTTCTRHLEAGMEPFAAAMKGAQEIGFTVFSISMSLIAVFIPILMMGGIIGRLFREFAVTLSTAILISMVISLTTTPCMCAHVLKADKPDEKHNWLYRASERTFEGMVTIYRGSLTWVLDNPWLTLVVLALTVVLNGLILSRIPTGFFPTQDTGALVGGIQGPQDASFPFMNFSTQSLVNVVKNDPAVAHVLAYITNDDKVKCHAAVLRA